jgi:hypothetical protein
MSSALAIAGVTAVLRNLLDDGLIDRKAADTLKRSVKVSVGPPDRVVQAGGAEESQLNLFLRQVTPNAAWRNACLPALDPTGARRLSNPPLALDLHYVLSAYGAEDLHAEILLGYAMQLLHETPTIPRKAIRRALKTSPAVNEGLPDALKALVDTGLDTQAELIKITPEPLSTEELSNLWNATQSPIRPTAAYLASVVLIQSEEPVRSPLPVLSRGGPADPTDPGKKRDRGVVVEPGLAPAVPTIEAVVPPGRQPVARLGEIIELHGHHLDGTNHDVLLYNDRFEIKDEIVKPTLVDPGLIRFTIPVADAAVFPAGVYRVGVRVQRPGETKPRETNRLALTLAPEITGLPMTVNLDGAGTASFTLTFHPALRAGQQALLVLGEQEIKPKPLTASTTSLSFEIAKAPEGELLARLRIDGIESPIVDRSDKDAPPVFLDKRIVIH